jgi:hypothetical protein
MNETKTEPDSQKQRSPLDSLTPELRAKLTKLQSEVSLNKLTTSFSIEERTQNGKKSTFYSATASWGHGAELTQLHDDSPSVGFNLEEVRVVRCILAKHVVAVTYDDAIKRGILGRKQAAEAILNSYDEALVKILTPNEPKA